MIIRCPNCSTTYKVSGSVFDAPKPTFRCTRCKHVFMVQVRLHLTDEEDSVVVEQGTERTGEASGLDDRGETADPPETSGVAAPPEEDVLGEDVPEDQIPEEWVPEDRVVEDDVLPPEAESTDDGPELPLETVGTGMDPMAVDPVEIDLHERMERGGPDDVAHSYRGFAIDTLETDPPETPATDQKGDLIDDEAPAGRRKPDFSIEDDSPVPPMREPREALRRHHRGGRGSTVPLVSLAGLAVFAFVLVTLMYHVNPQPLDSLIKRVPWYGNAVFDSRHFKRTLVCESLVSGVRPVLNHNEVFVVSGKLANHNDRSVHQVRIEARLFDAEGKELAQETTFVGNAISAKIIQDMTFREISLLQSLKPQNNYQIAPNGSANFTIVFPKPETTVETFSCRVVSAELAA